MIYKNPTAPVLLKKINLKVWSLKEELTHLIMSQIDSVEESELIKKLVEDYTLERPKLRLIKNEESPELQSIPGRSICRGKSRGKRSCRGTRGSNSKL